MKPQKQDSCLTCFGQDFAKAHNSTALPKCGVWLTVQPLLTAAGAYPLIGACYTKEHGKTRSKFEPKNNLLILIC